MTICKQKKMFPIILFSDVDEINDQLLKVFYEKCSKQRMIYKIQVLMLCRIA